MADENLQVLANGAVYDHSVKRIVKAPPKERQYITQENARELITARWEKQRQVWIEGGQLAADHITTRQLPVWQEIGYSTAKNAIAGEGRVQVEAARLFGQYAGYVQERGANGGDNGPAVRLELSQSAFMALAGIVQEALDNSILSKASVIDLAASESRQVDAETEKPGAD